MSLSIGCLNGVQVIFKHQFLPKVAHTRHLHFMPGCMPVSHFYPFKVGEYIEIVLAPRSLIIHFTR